MNNIIDMKIKEILDKKFNKKIRSGYDPEDVDLFFDEVIKFLQEIHASTNALHEKDSLREQQLQWLKNELEQKQKTIQTLEQENSTLKSEGYHYQKIKSDIRHLNEMNINKDKK